MPPRFAHDEKTSRNVGRWLGPLLVFEAVVLGLIMWAVLKKEDHGSVWAWVGAIGPVMLLVAVCTVLFLGIRVRVRVDSRHYSVRLWPTPFKSQVALREIKDAYVREVDPMRDYGGWGLKGKRSDLLYSLGGKRAVTVEYRRKRQTRKLTVTTERADDLLTALTK